MSTEKLTDEGKQPIARLEDARNALSLSITAFCRLTGLRYNSYHTAVQRGSALSEDVLRAVAIQTRISVQWVLTGEGAMLRSGEADTDAGYIKVPVYWDVVLSAGNGAIPPDVDEYGEMRPFMELELRQFSTNPHNLAIVKVTGTSMEPLLHAGDEVMVDFSAPVTLRDGLYAVRLGDVLLVKHLQRLPEGKIVLRSENPLYEPVEIDLKKGPEDFAVIGRVVWGARRY